jgi:hypothetical protein
MDTVVLNGVTYLKSSAIAEQFKYSSDYVGQLCREKKVDAQLVGRTWFVNPQSVQDHKKAAGQPTPEPTQSHPKKSQADDMASNVKIKRVHVEAPLKNKTVKSTTDKTHSARKNQHPATEKAHSVRITYGQDSEDLIPGLNEKPVSELPKEPPKPQKILRYLHVAPTMAKKIKIKANKSKHTTYDTTDLPDVALSGKVSVADYEPVDTAVTTDDKKKAPAPVKEISNAIEQPETTSHATQVKINTDTSSLESTGHSDNDADLETCSKSEVQSHSNKPTPFLILVSPLLGTLLAATVSFFIIALATEVVAFDMTSDSMMSLQLTKFTEFLSL